MVNVSLEPYFSPQTFCFQENNNNMLTDLFCFQMTNTTLIRNHTLLADLDSLHMILNPQITILRQGEVLHFMGDDREAVLQIGSPIMNYSGNTLQLASPPIIEDGEVYVPILDILAHAFGWHVKTGNYQEKGLYQISKNPDTKFDIFGLNYLLHQSNGILKRAYYLEEAGQICPYRLFVPTSYTTEKNWKMAVILHGLNGEDVFEKGNQKLAHMGEKYQYLILAPIAYTRGMHGSCYPMARTFVDPQTTDPENPAALTSEEKKIYHLCELANTKAIRQVISEYAIDENNIFLGGNSMGSDGTYYLGSKYPHLFRAISPCGGGPDFRYFPISEFKNKPIRLLCGTEDPGYHLVYSMYQNLIQNGIEAEFSRVAGEAHGTAWIYDLDGMFEFFNKNIGGNFNE